MGTAGTPGQRQSALSRWASLCFLTLALGALAVGCGSSSSPSATPRTEDQLLTAAEIRKEPRGSVERSFLDYWSSLQFRSWADAAAYYDPRFRDFVGTASVIGAKKFNSSVYPLVQPHIVRVDSAGGEATIDYTLTLPEGAKELDSITWRRNGGSWQIIYDSRLDAELGQFASNEVEIEKTGAIPTSVSPVSPEAVRAAKAAEKLQARFLQEELKTSAP